MDYWMRDLMMMVGAFLVGYCTAIVIWFASPSFMAFVGGATFGSAVVIGVLAFILRREAQDYTRDDPSNRR